MLGPGVLLAIAAAVVVHQPPSYTNPVLRAAQSSAHACLQGDPSGCERPDPGVTWDPAQRAWLAVTTSINSTNGTFATHASDDLVSWRARGFVWGPGAAAGRPRWGVGNWFAPELHQLGPALWVLVFSATWRESGQQAVGAAFASAASGPFVDQGAPVLLAHNNTNDPTVAVDAQSGTMWLLYKAKSPDHIYAQRVEVSSHEEEAAVLSAGVGASPPPPPPPRRLAPATAAPPVLLLTADLPWETGVIEAPWVVSLGSSGGGDGGDGGGGGGGATWPLYLFYAADWDKLARPPDHKAIGVARSRTIDGPWEKRPLPVLRARPPNASSGTGAGPTFVSPGHCSVVGASGGAAGGAWAMVYHASWLAPGATAAGPRQLLVDRLTWGADGWPRVGAGGAGAEDGYPSQTAQGYPLQPNYAYHHPSDF
jgi:beta-xylosidase